MKSNFVISACQEAWIPCAKRLFATDPYIMHVLEREGRLSEYEDIQVAQPLRTTREEFQDDHEFVDRKYRKYIQILVQRLDELHGTCHGASFWQKALSLSILRHVSLCHDLFKICEINLKPEFHDCRTLDQASYYTPVDFDDHRRLFQHTNFGQEQLFSVYCNLFYPGQFTSFQKQAPLLNPDIVPALRQTPNLWRRFTPRRIMRWLLRTRSPRVGILNAYFSQEHNNQLLFESLGHIQVTPLPDIPASDSAIRWNLRKELARDEPNFDRFDRFVFACLHHGMPRIFVEDFPQVYTHLKLHFSHYKYLRWVVSEAWIGHTLSSLALAVLQQQGVKHIYNEHNYLSCFFVGNSLKYLIPLADEFVTLGWNDPSIPNLVRGASLFPWVEKNTACPKEHNILLILGLPIVHLPEISAAYGDSGAYGASGYIEMNRRFLARLEEETLHKLYIRSYPSKMIRDWLFWDQFFALSPYSRKVKTYDDNAPISARSLMQCSQLVVVNYLSTAYLESIIANIPTIFFWNRNTNLFTEKYMSVFNGLIGAGICQTTPEGAADFINQIKDNPEKWWHSAAVQESRAAFLEAHIGDPETMIRHLLAKAA